MWYHYLPRQVFKVWSDPPGFGTWRVARFGLCIALLVHWCEVASSAGRAVRLSTARRLRRDVTLTIVLVVPSLFLSSLERLPL